MHDDEFLSEHKPSVHHFRQKKRSRESQTERESIPVHLYIYTSRHAHRLLCREGKHKLRHSLCNQVRHWHRKRKMPLNLARNQSCTMRTSQGFGITVAVWLCIKQCV